MPDIDLEWYRSFVAIYRVGTVSGAAAERFITQPAVSQHLAALESAMGTALFSRTPRRMIPTERGKELYARVVAAIDALEQITSEVGEERDQSVLLRLGAPLEYFSEVALDQFINANIRCWARFDVTSVLLEALERGELDLVIATQRLPAQSIEYTRLIEETFLLVGAAKGPHPGDDRFGEEELAQMEQWLAQQRWISYGPDLPIIRRFWQQTFGKRPELRPSLVVPNLHAIRHAVLAGAGISLLPGYLCAADRAESRLDVLWEPPQPVLNELWIATRRQDRTHPGIQQACTVLLAR
ncbi:MAG TPA: LysR family transcriptional regulator [Ktedonosporobacter sp.]|nr:LysR family transcriptional regulator [Ktedonosporobacter sp.]